MYIYISGSECPGAVFLQKLFAVQFLLHHLLSHLWTQCWPCPAPHLLQEWLCHTKRRCHNKNVVKVDKTAQTLHEDVPKWTPKRDPFKDENLSLNTLCGFPDFWRFFILTPSLVKGSCYQLPIPMFSGENYPNTKLRILIPTCIGSALPSSLLKLKSEYSWTICSQIWHMGEWQELYE
jgi:hypothetical protein